MIIYALTDPRNGEIRYIGKSFRTAHRRLRRHLAPSQLRGESYKEHWIRDLLKIGLQPEIAVLQKCQSADELNEAERGHIARLRLEGKRLTNASNGGDGGAGPHTPESRAKISAALKGKKKSETHRLRVALANTGRKASPETRALLSAMRRGKCPPPSYGSNNPKSKLRREQVQEIINLRGVISQRSLAIRFGVSKTAIRYIHIGRNWLTLGENKEDLRVREFPEVRNAARV